MARFSYLCVLVLFLAGPMMASPLAGEEVEDMMANPAASDEVKEMLATTTAEPVKPEPVKPAETVLVEEEKKEEPEMVVVKEPSKEEKPEGRGYMNNIVQPSPVEDELLEKLNIGCAQRETSACIKLKLISYMNKLLKKASIQLTDSVELSQTTRVENLSAQSIVGSTLPRNVEEVDSSLTEVLADKIWTFVKTRSLKWKVFPEAALTFGTSPDQDGNVNLGLSFNAGEALENGRQKMGKNILPFLAAAVAKIGILGALAFGGLVLLVGKALLLSKVALLLALIIALKKLFAQKAVTYEVVGHSHSGHGDGHESYGAYGRSDTAHNMAYRGQVPGARSQ